MVETLVKTPSCSKCGEDARPHALFCHACGGKIIDLPEDEEGNVSSAWFRGDIVEASDQDASISGAAVERKMVDEEEADPADASIEKPDDNLLAEEKPESGAVKIKPKETDSGEKPKKIEKMTAASDLRRRPKPVRTKRVEVVWEQNYGSPNWMFLLFGLLLAAIGVAIFVLAFYLK